MIRLRLLWPVNPKTDAKKCDPITIGAMLWLVDDENRAGLILIKPRCFVEEECADEAIDKSTDFRDGTFATCRRVRDVVAIRGKADVARTINFGSD